MDTIVFTNNWLYDIHLASTLQNHYPEVFTLPDGNFNNDTLKINGENSLKIVVAYTPKSESQGVKDSTVLFITWDKVENNLNYTNTIDLLGLGNDPVGIENETINPIKFELFQNYPNPFNPSTLIQYSLPIRQAGIPRHDGSAVEGQHFTLKVFDILGNEIAVLVNENQTAGNYQITFDGSRLASGIYFYQIRSGEFIQSRKMMLLK